MRPERELYTLYVKAECDCVCLESQRWGWGGVGVEDKEILELTGQVADQTCELQAKYKILPQK